MTISRYESGEMRISSMLLDLTAATTSTPAGNSPNISLTLSSIDIIF